MLRMDFLLNPGSPPASPARSENQNINQNELRENQEPTVEHPLATTDCPTVSAVSGIVLPPLQRQPELPASPTAAPAVKRIKRDLPALRLLVEAATENQVDDAPHEIFSGQAFWGKVPSLNSSMSPSDVSQVVLPSLPSRTVPIQPRRSFVRELQSVPVLPTVPTAKIQTVQHDVDTSEDSLASMDGESQLPEAGGTCGVAETTTTTTSARGSKKKKITICKEDGCTSQALSKQLCMKHGGGPRCSVPDCNNGAKLRNLCFQHGGSTICLAPGCSSKAKRFGYCWSHGGGRICAQEDCDKVAAQGGMCWAHGGGNRCKLAGCTKRSYKQHGYYCKRHAEVSADY